MDRGLSPGGHRAKNPLVCDFGRNNFTAIDQSSFLLGMGAFGMCRNEDENLEAELDRLQTSYKVAVESWIEAIRIEEALASVNHSVAEIDKWENAHFIEDELRTKALAAKEAYEDALRRKFFGF
jgi:hypothetical protein